MKKVLLTATVQSHICQFHRPLAEVLHEQGWEVHAAARDNLAEKGGLKLDFADKVFDVPFSRSPGSTDNIAAYKALKKIIGAEHYDVIHCNTPMGGIVTRLAARGARKHGTKVYYTAHGFHFYQGAPKINWLVFYPVEKFFSRMTDKLITINQEDYKLTKEKFHCKAEYIHGVGVDEERYFPISRAESLSMKEAMGFGREQKVILCIGELLPNKNQKMAIHMMKELVKKYPDAILLLAGNGPEKDNLEKEIKSVGLENNVRMLGYVTNLQDYQHISDVVVSCSRREGLPLNIVESMLSGTPVTASDNRGHRELIHDGMNGFLVDVDNPKQMGEKILALLSDDELSKRISDQARIYAETYGIRVVKEELRKVYGFCHE